MTRVVKQGGRIVFGDESLPPWLEGTEFGEMIVTNNPLFKHKLPLEHLPINAREVTLRWLLGGCSSTLSISKSVTDRHRWTLISRIKAGAEEQFALVTMEGWKVLPRKHARWPSNVRGSKV